MGIRRQALFLCSVEYLHHNFMTLFIQLLWALLKVSRVYLKLYLYALRQIPDLELLLSSQVHTFSGTFYIPEIVHNSFFRSKEEIDFQICIEK